MLCANVVILVGEVSQQPRAFAVGQGRKASVLVSQKRTFGEGKTANDVFEVVGWGTMASKVEFLPLGATVMVQGKLRPESYEKDGKRVYKNVVVAESVTLEGDNKEVQKDLPSDDPF